MSASTEVLKAFGDAYVTVYGRSFDRLEIDIQLWDETVAQIVAEEAGAATEMGTWECEGLVRLDATSEGTPRFAVIDTDQNPTLSFTASRVSYVSPDGTSELLAPK